MTSHFKLLESWGLFCEIFNRILWKSQLQLLVAFCPPHTKALAGFSFLPPAAKLLWGKSISETGAQTLRNRQSFFTLLFCLHVFPAALLRSYKKY